MKRKTLKPYLATRASRLLTALQLRGGCWRVTAPTPPQKLPAGSVAPLY